MNQFLQNHSSLLAIATGTAWLISEVLGLRSGAEKPAGIFHGIMLFLQSLGGPKMPDSAKSNSTDKAA